MAREQKIYPEAEKLGQKLQRCREKKRLTQQEVADYCGVSKNYISAVERGINHISVFKFAKYCEKCGVTPNDMLIRKDDRIILDLEKALLQLNGAEQQKVLDCVKIMFDL